MPDWVVSSLARHGDTREEQYTAFLRTLARRGSALNISTVAESLAEQARPDSRNGDALRLLFDDLARVWNEDTMASSSMSEICEHWAYRCIMDLGRPVVPLILERIKGGERHWGWALASITGENPAEQCETLRSAAEAWIQWGMEKGLLRREPASLD